MIKYKAKSKKGSENEQDVDSDSFIIDTKPFEGEDTSQVFKKKKRKAGNNSKMKKRKQSKYLKEFNDKERFVILFLSLLFFLLRKIKI